MTTGVLSEPKVAERVRPVDTASRPRSGEVATVRVETVLAGTAQFSA